MPFRFEADFADSLRCIPMAVRLRLDLSGVKLKLSEWSKLGLEQRQALADAPCGSSEEIAGFGRLAAAWVAQACGAPPALMPPADRIWENTGEIPAQVSDKAAHIGAVIAPGAWAALSDLQRFALIKLSRSSHEGNNFRPALEEFGLMSFFPR